MERTPAKPLPEHASDNSAPGRQDGIAGRQRRPRISLRARALSLLARREQSRQELTRKLAPHADSREQVETLLDTLESQGLLSSARFIESMVHRRADRFGAQRIRHELRQHGLDSSATSAALEELERTEFARALAVWERRFGAPPLEPGERIRQTRFMLSRGFSADAVRRVLGGNCPDDFES